MADPQPGYGTVISLIDQTNSTVSGEADKESIHAETLFDGEKNTDLANSGFAYNKDHPRLYGEEMAVRREYNFMQGVARTMAIYNMTRGDLYGEQLKKANAQRKAALQAAKQDSAKWRSIGDKVRKGEA